MAAAIDPTLDFRAPPPSPIASGRRSCVTNDEVLSEFLENSLRVPDLVLPDKVFPRQKFIENPPTVDFQLFGSMGRDSVSKILDSVARIGCFQVVNYGIPVGVIRSALSDATGIFRVPKENRAAVTRSSEKPYGFEEVHVEDESELNEEFVWCRDEGLKMEMEGIWPIGYSNFSEKMEIFMTEVEKIAEKILLIFRENSWVDEKERNIQGEEQVGPVCYVYKHGQNVSGEERECSLRYVVIKMLVRGIDYSHALCLHVCDGSSEFHVYSKKGWVSFCPDKDALIVTVGDQIQAMSGGHYKHVMGRPIYRDEHQEWISMAFLYSSGSKPDPKREKTISVGQQALVAVMLTLAYQILFYVYSKF